MLDRFCDGETVTYVMCYNNTQHLVSENKTQPRHNYSDSVMKQVDSMTKRLAPEEINNAGTDASRIGVCNNQNIIFYTILTTTMVNIVIFLAFSLICKKRNEVEVKEYHLSKEEVEHLRNYKPILKENDLKSPYECI